MRRKKEPRKNKILQLLFFILFPIFVLYYFYSPTHDIAFSPITHPHGEPNILPASLCIIISDKLFALPNALLDISFIFDCISIFFTLLELVIIPYCIFSIFVGNIIFSASVYIKA